MRTCHLHTGCNLIDAVRAAAELGVQIRHQKGGGELIFSHHATQWRIRVNGRRKDAPRSLTTGLRQLGELLQVRQ